MRSQGILVLALYAWQVVAANADPAGRWNFAYNNGITEYSTGTWDATTGAALIVSCSDRSASVVAQISGKVAPPRSRLLLTFATRKGTNPIAVLTDAAGSAEMPARSTDFTRLWAALRGGDIVTVSYEDGRSGVLSLAGAAATLPRQPCG
jgi:hypothetical protein